jgi:tRNA(Arg) A34 adenosine deaminase TadA
MPTGRSRPLALPARRAVLRGLAGLGGASALAVLLAPSRPAGGDTPGAAGPPLPVDAAGFMRRALELRRAAEARGDQPYGAVVVRAGQIVGEGASAVVVGRDPTAHAEMEAIRDACRRLGTRDLGACELYATSRPCRMCATAAYWARLSRIYVGSPVSDAGPPRYDAC